MLFLVQLLSRLEAGEGIELSGQELGFGIDVPSPGELSRTVPLFALRFLVEFAPERDVLLFGRG